MLAEKLNMTPDDAERWIVNLIRNARLDAKIDSKLVSYVLLLLAVALGCESVKQQLHVSTLKSHLFFSPIFQACI